MERLLALEIRGKSKITSTGGREANFFSRFRTAYSAATERRMLTLPFGQLSRWEEHNRRLEDDSDVFSLGHLANDAITD